MTPVHALKRFVPLVGVVLVVGCGYNTIQTYDEQVNAAASQIKVQLQRRADLIPNLVETVKAYAKQERTVFTEVAEARAKLAGAVQGGDLQQMAEANRQLTAPLGRLSPSPRTTRSSSPTRTSARCRTSSKGPKTASPWRGRTTTKR